MRRWWYQTVVVLAGSLILLTSLSAQEKTSAGSGDLSTAIKFSEKPTALALQDLTLFKKEPKNLWFFTSNPEGELGIIPKDGKFKIVETKYVYTLFERSVWLRVSPSSDLGLNPVTGWVYAGRSMDDQFVIPVLEKK